ncbi:MAG: LacI family DNA-binding transcriptional regulator [Candidatus Methylacidiphilales bacterium]
MPQPKRLNQQTIAKATGVSRATVSLILRGGIGSSESTRARVLAMAEKMGYRPNALVQSIRSGKSRTMGVLVPPHDSFWQNVCYGIHDRLTESDHLPLFLWDSEHHDLPREQYALQQIHRLLDRWVDGVILWPEFAKFYAKHLHEFERRNIPVVIIDHIMPELAVDTVSCDERQIARLIVPHLTALGHRDILVVSGPEHLGWADDRCAALQREAEVYADGPRQDEALTLRFLRIPFGSDVTAQILNALQDFPGCTAVIGCTDHLANKAYRAAHQMGYIIPQDLSVIGVGDLTIAPILSPPLTTVRQDGYAVGVKAAQAGMERSAGLLTGPARRYTIPVQLIERNSTASRRPAL